MASSKAETVEVIAGTSVDELIAIQQAAHAT